MEVQSCDDGDVCGIPLCTVCGHMHVQGIKCHICGHVGRSQIFQKMKLRAAVKRETKTMFYDGARFISTVDDWDVIMELRKRTYCLEDQTPIDEEFDENLEKSSRHAVCYGRRHILNDVNCFVLL